MGYGDPVVELHVSWDGKPNELQAQCRDHPSVRALMQRAQQALPAGAAFELHVRPKAPRHPIKQQFIARRLFAGRLRDIGTGKPVESIQWAVALEHVAHTGDPADQTPPTFSLLSRQQGDEQFRFECRNTAAQLVEPIRIECR